MMILTATNVAISIVLGSALGAGLCCMIAASPRWGAPTLSRRIAPYIRDIADPLGLTPLASYPTSLAGAWLGVRSQLDVIAGGSTSINRRLRHAGWRIDTATYRVRQLTGMLAGCTLGALTTILLSLTGQFSIATLVLPAVGAVAGVVTIDVTLSRALKARSVRIGSELPTVLEFLSLCVSAGEGLFDSLKRVGHTGVGELATEIETTTLAVGTGSSLPDALADLARRTSHPALDRSIDHIISAIERGAPLAHVLQAQANDAREEAKRSLIEQAGRKEIGMLIPLVFIILPLSVLFAVFPGIAILRLGIS
ncbi:tight adherence protein C [Microbacterium endophyticum]|uniref:Tight adherence protein C n=1 Tax=Microbacterium endophyticum TaxID=1526412 RepID=A0A7W4YMJ8_9MICO|nr:type II secretion system F family protein [Microbacterium endophyticum]MBB2974726.1 tight adherence protein C [Microbacterium endophyticum]NIK37023.1 tight adherence protein C [Microbacterium endophyticum]